MLLQWQKIRGNFVILYYFIFEMTKWFADTKWCIVFSEAAVDDSMCRKWFKKFRANNFNIREASRSGQPTDADIGANWKCPAYKTDREIVEILEIKNAIVSSVDYLNLEWLARPMYVYRMN